MHQLGLISSHILCTSLARQLTPISSGFIYGSIAGNLAPQSSTALDNVLLMIKQKLALLINIKSNGSIFVGCLWSKCAHTKDLKTSSE